VSTTGPDQARPRVRYGPTLVIGLAGAVAVMVGVAKPWVTATARQTGLPQIEVSVSGADLAPLAGALGVVVLAAFGAVIATRGWVRRCLGGLIVVASLVVLVSAIHPPGATGALEDALSAKGWSGGDYDSGTAWWRWLALVGSVATTLAGVAISLYGARWATMGAAYDAPGTAQDTVPAKPHDAASASEADVWREIDEGRDPTDDQTRHFGP
jgi:uncharacterized membrane protein (TIGR02234 family)